jgi:hypothetical protein
MGEVLTPEQRENALKLIENPPFGSDLEKAKRWGMDLHELVDNLCLTPTERLRKMTRRVNLMMERTKRKQLKKTKRQRQTNSELLLPPESVS